ncbi:MAG TPA: hypothetical protein VF614_06145 [Chthoniobacteraceae bacterium]|jgi:hypothetical protein
MNNYSIIETLEARIAPAAVLTLTDVDGDIVTITSSKGTDAQLDKAVQRLDKGSVGGVEIVSIALDKDGIFEGTDLSIVAKRGPSGGDGLVNVGRIDAANDFLDDFDAGRNLGRIFVDGNLKDFDAGTGAADSKVESLSVHSTSGTAVWNVNANIGTFAVKTDLRGVQIDLTTTFDIGKVKIGGSLVGEVFKLTGVIRAADIGLVKIGGDVVGGSGTSSGSILSKTIGSLRIGGSLEGGAGGYSSHFYANKVGSVSIGGSLLGGTGAHSGGIDASKLGKVKIHGDVRGGGGVESGLIGAHYGIGGVTIGGDLEGGSGGHSGQIRAGSDQIAGGIGHVDIGGSITGSASYSGSLSAFGDIASVTVGHDLKGGSGVFSGTIRTGETLGPVRIGGSVLGGEAMFTGTVSGGGGIKSVLIGGDLQGGSVADAGMIIAGVSLSGWSGAQSEPLGPVKIKGNLVGSAAAPVSIVATGNTDIGKPLPVAIKSLTVKGNVEFARVLAGHDLLGPTSGDAGIGAVKVAGNWTASILAAGANAGGDQRFATPDDVVIAGGNGPELFSRIASITIGGKVGGTPASGDHFGFVAQEIGSLSVAGTQIPLKVGRSNDNVGLVGAKYELGSTGDFTARELA